MTYVNDRRDLLKATATAGAIGLAGCVGGMQGSNGRTIKTGMLIAETGDLSSVGVPLRDVGVLPRIQVNEGDTDFEVDMQIEDSQTDPQAAIAGASALADAGYPAVMGPLTSENTIQVTKQVYRPRQIVCCTPGSTSPAITELQDNGYVFRTISSDAFQGRALAQVARDRVDASKVAILYVNDAYGQALERTFRESFTANGGTVTSSTPIAKERSSYTSKLQQAMADDPDALFVVAFPATANQLLRDFYSSYGKETPILGPDSLRDPTLPGKVGQSLTNVLGVSSVAAGPGQEFVANLYTEEYGEETPPFFSYVYDATAILALANAAAGENAGPAIRDQMRPTANPGGKTVTPETLVDGIEMAASGTDIDYRGASSNVNFDENGDMKAVNYAVYRYTADDTIEEVERIEFETDSETTTTR